MPLPTERSAVELFHLLLLRLVSAGADRDHLVLKGGCNLRFFHGSPRYSEDLDLDARVASAATMRRRIDKALSSSTLALLLRAHGLTLASTSAPKQTETTQRWKIGLALEGLERELRTKVELSRRERTDAFVVGPVDREIARVHGVTPPVLAHYPAETAFRQKLRALTGRDQTQARDVFDLDLLLSRRPAGALDARELALVPKAIDRAMELPFRAFRSQVVAYLVPELQPLYDAPDAWEQMQLRVVTSLEEIER